MKDIDRDGIAAVADRALALAADGTGGIHVSFDMDVCDPSIAPGVGTPVKGGLDYREAHMVMELVADSRRLVAIRSGRCQPNARRPQRDRGVCHRTGALRARQEHPLNRDFRGCRPARSAGMSRALLKFNGGSVHDYATIADDSPIDGLETVRRLQRPAQHPVQPEAMQRSGFSLAPTSSTGTSTSCAALTMSSGRTGR